MNKFKFYFILLITTVSLFSCSKNDTPTYEPPRDYKTQYDVDIADIEEYLNTNYITVVNHPGFVDDQNVTITKIDAAQPSIMSYTANAFAGSTVFPQLWSKDVSKNNIIYKLYYLVLRPGIGESPCNVDGVMTSYRGDYLERTGTSGTTVTTVTATKFEEVVYPQAMISLFTTISGWSETFPIFKTGTYTANADGSITHYDFGAGVMFLPSGLAYYNTGSGSIPAYSPLVFSFKLYELQRLDQDNDGIFSFQEDLNGDGYVRTLATGVVNPDDTDGDGVPNFLDVDDDGDNYTTRLEITKPAGTNSGLSAYFPYDPIVDNPLTTAIETETKGVPEYSAAGTPDYTTPTRLRIYLDKAHHTAKP
ncbi:MAG: hypothetical protein JHC39_09610 [Lentimicrobium sp.]|nr:hypothetical protein [Lentimicrobium sp.]